MARKRQIDPDIWVSEQVITLPVEARLLFIGMISHADDAGRLRGSALSLKVTVFPSDTYGVDQIQEWRDAIVKKRLAVWYESEGWEYLWLPTFLKYQYMTRISPSKLPSPPSLPPQDSHVNNNALTTPPQGDNEGVTTAQHLYGDGVGGGVGNGIGIGIGIVEAAPEIETSSPVITESPPGHSNGDEKDTDPLIEELYGILAGTTGWPKATEANIAKLQDACNDYGGLNYLLEFKKFREYWNSRKKLQRPWSALLNWLERAKAGKEAKHAGTRNRDLPTRTEYTPSPDYTGWD